MPSTYSTNLRLELMATGENRTTWGNKANQVFNMAEDAIAGYASIAMANANYTLTTANGTVDEARNMLIQLTGAHSAIRTLTIPAVSKTYLFRNATTGGFAVTISNGTNTVSVPNGAWAIVWTDGTLMYSQPDMYALSSKLADLSGVTNAATARVNLGLVIGVDVGIPVPSGTKTIFVQTAAPTGWTKDTTHDNKALRIVSGAAGTGGSVAFTTAFASQAVTGSNTAVVLTDAQLSSHTHTQTGSFNTGTVSADHSHFFNVNSGTVSANHNHNFTYVDTHAGGGGVQGSGGSFGPYTAGVTGTENQNHVHNVQGNTGGISANHFHNVTISGQTGVTGADNSHNHTFTGTAINMAVSYVDCIICTKN